MKLNEQFRVISMLRTRVFVFDYFKSEKILFDFAQNMVRGSFGAEK